MRRGIATVTMVVAALALPATAGATSATATLTGVNGEGTFNNTLPCGVGDGPNWRYFWLDQTATSPGGVLAGSWNGSFEVHDAGAGKAFVPNNDGRLSITLNRSGNPDRAGTGFFDTLGDGGCANANLALTTQIDGDPQVTGTLPLVALGGTGALRGLTGNGNATFTLELGAGADNQASIALAGNFDVADPALSIVGASSRWRNLTDWLGGWLTTYITVANAQGAGDAFDVRLTGVSGGTGVFSGLPSVPLSIPNGRIATFSFTMKNAHPNTSYTLTGTAAGKDGLLAPIPAISGSASFKSPLLP